MPASGDGVNDGSVSRPVRWNGVWEVGGIPRNPFDCPKGGLVAFPSQTQKAAKEMGGKGAFGGSWNRMIICAQETGQGHVRSRASEAELG